MRPKGVVDGNAVNIPQPVGSDGVQRMFEIIGFRERSMSFQEITPAYRPYPKPTQVDELSILRRLREWC